MTPAATHLVTTDAVAERLDCSIFTVRRMMADTTKAGIAQPWVLVGARPRWYAARIDRWLEELTKWRQSRSAASPTSSAGTPSRRAKGDT